MNLKVRGRRFQEEVAGMKGRSGGTVSKGAGGARLERVIARERAAVVEWQRTAGTKSAPTATEARTATEALPVLVLPIIAIVTVTILITRGGSSI
ncbi:hypothetical protein [Paenibacillus yonginensis]|uniref:hypothetical protein n=1 Tax=Paenibacillus yonginensis TaxID=1462996 RepID=UPI001470B6D3|nr:hypothetical protein [Paenibacillus yonginensis]